MLTRSCLHACIRVEDCEGAWGVSPQNSVPSRRRISGSAEFWPAAKNRPKKVCGRRKRRRILESRLAAEKIGLHSEMYKLAHLYFSSSAASDHAECMFSTVGLD